jgi:hypothetical protein
MRRVSFPSQTPKITLGYAYAPLLEAALDPLGFLRILRQHRQIPDGGVMPGAQGPFWPTARAASRAARSPQNISCARKASLPSTTITSAAAAAGDWRCRGTPSMRWVAWARPPLQGFGAPRRGSRSLGPRRRPRVLAAADHA